MIHALGIHVLRHDIVHPSTRTFAGTGEIVGVEDTDQFAVCTGHLEYFYLGVIYWHILQRLELQAIQFGSHAERAFAHIAQFEVRLDLFLVQCIFGFAQFLGIVPPIPWLQFLARQVSVQHFLQFCSLTLGSSQRGNPHGLQESVHRLMILRHAVLQDIVGRIVVAEQVGTLDTQLHLTDNNGFVVVLIVVVGTSGIIHQQLLAQFAVLAVLQYGRERCTLGCEQPLARMSGSRSLFCSRSLGAFRQTFQFFFVGYETPAAVCLGYNVSAELQREQSQFLVNLLQAFFLVCRQVGTIVHKAPVGLSQQSHLLGCQIKLLTLVINRFYACKQCIVQHEVRMQF